MTTTEHPRAHFTSFEESTAEDWAIIAPQLAITPDVQLLINPALNPDEDQIWVFGLRARLAL